MPRGLAGAWCDDYNYPSLLSGDEGGRFSARSDSQDGLDGFFLLSFLFFSSSPCFHPPLSLCSILFFI